MNFLENPCPGLALVLVPALVLALVLVLFLASATEISWTSRLGWQACKSDNHDHGSFQIGVIAFSWLLKAAYMFINLFVLIGFDARRLVLQTFVWL